MMEKACLRRPLLKFAMLWLSLAVLVWLPTPEWLRHALVDGSAELIFLTALMGMWLFHTPHLAEADLPRRAHRHLGTILLLWWGIRFLDLFPDYFTHSMAFALIFDFTYLLIYLTVLHLLWDGQRRACFRVAMMTLVFVWLLLICLFAMWQPRLYQNWWPSMVFYIIADLFLLMQWSASHPHSHQPLFFRRGLLALALIWCVLDVGELFEYVSAPWRLDFGDAWDVMWWFAYAPFWFLLASLSCPWPSAKAHREPMCSSLYQKILATGLLMISAAYTAFLAPSSLHARTTLGVLVGVGLIAIWCCHQSKTPLPPDHRPNLSEIEDAVRSHILEGNLSTTKLARELGFEHRALLRRYLQKKYGTTLRQLIHRVQLRLLSEYTRNGLPVHEAVNKAGFQDAYHCQQVLAKMGISMEYWLSHIPRPENEISHKDIYTQ